MKTRTYLIFTLLVASVTCATRSAKAEEIQWGSFNFFFLTADSGNPAVPIGDAALLGHFDSSFSFSLNTTFAQLMAGFQQYSSTTIGTNFGGPTLPAGQFFATTNPPNTLPGVAGDQVYFWVFNNAVPALATQWALVTNPSWVRPPTGPTGLGTFDLSDPGTIAVGPITSIDGSGNAILGFAPIPEPSAIMLGLVGGVAMLGVVRRRRSRVTA